MIWFSSDLHFDHRNLCLKHRKFRSVDYMNKLIIDNCNSVIGNNDEFYILGDISFAKLDKTIELVSQLNGKKHLILGNHDKYLAKKKEFRELFLSVDHYREIDVYHKDTGEKQRICMSHYPMLVWNRSHYGSVALHGHCHGSMVYPFEGRIMDVGMDCWGFKPVECFYILDILNKIEPYKPDHHGSY